MRVRRASINHWRQGLEGGCGNANRINGEKGRAMLRSVPVSPPTSRGGGVRHASLAEGVNCQRKSEKICYLWRYLLLSGGLFDATWNIETIDNSGAGERN